MKERTQSFEVKPEHSAKYVGSGTLDVLSTPMLTAFMEETAAKSVEGDLPEGHTSVGTYLEINHLKASAIGSLIDITATTNELSERKATFSVTAQQNGVIIGTAEHTRAVIQIDRFMKNMLK
ncbi:hypothetical protein HYO62_03105 [Aerococcaceae bacterium DSM 111022]|nr:hypothetical protein [Aerococcaceae bacterium DSM 111022]